MTHRNDNQKQTVLPTSNFHQFGLAGVITSSATPPQVFLSSLPAWFLLHRLNRFTSQQPIRSKPMEQRVKRQDDEASMCCHFATFCFGHISFAHTQCFVLFFFTLPLCSVPTPQSAEVFGAAAPIVVGTWHRRQKQLPFAVFNSPFLPFKQVSHVALLARTKRR